MENNYPPDINWHNDPCEDHDELFQDRDDEDQVTADEVHSYFETFAELNDIPKFNQLINE